MIKTPVQVNWQEEVVVIGRLVFKPSNCLNEADVFDEKPSGERSFCNYLKSVVVVHEDKCLDLCHLRRV